MRLFERVSLWLSFLLLGIGIGFAPPAQAWDDQTAQFLVLVNAYRAQNGAGPLIIDAHLQAAAEWMAQDMEQRSVAGTCCDHTDSTGRTFDQRLRDFGYPCPSQYGCGENLEWGSWSILGPADLALAYWQESPPHDANIRNTSYTVTGIAVICVPPTGGGCWWVQDLGTGLSAPFLTGTPTPTRQPTTTATSQPTRTRTPEAPTATPSTVTLPTATHPHATQPASPSRTPTAAGAPHSADLNGDGKVDIFDFSLFAAAFGQHGPNLSADFNHDGVVDIFDLSQFAAAFSAAA